MYTCVKQLLAYQEETVTVKWLCAQMTFSQYLAVSVDVPVSVVSQSRSQVQSDAGSQLTGA